MLLVKLKILMMLSLSLLNLVSVCVCVHDVILLLLVEVNSDEAETKDLLKKLHNDTYRIEINYVTKEDSKILRGVYFPFEYSVSLFSFIIDIEFLTLFREHSITMRRP